MTTPSLPVPTPSPAAIAFARRLRACATGLAVFIAACGGSADAPPPAENAPTGVAPVITQQPADLSVANGQPASFAVVATGTAPLAYQWRRNGSSIAGASAATYSIAATAPADTGAVFSAVVSNGYGSATSHDAALTVTTAPPVLTITPQPTSTSVVAGAPASFTVGGTCSTGTLTIQWQRLNGAAYADIAGATAATYMFTTSSTDNGTQFRAVLSCSGQSTTPSSTATLTVTTAVGITLTDYPWNGLRPTAIIGTATALDKLPDGTFAYSTGAGIKKIAADLSSISTFFVGDQYGTSELDGTGTAATFSNPSGITHDAAGNLYVVDRGGNTIRRVTPAGVVTTIAGNPAMSGSVDGTGRAATFTQPRAIAMGPDGNLYVADTGGNKIRQVTTAGVVTTVAGSGTSGLVNGRGAAAQFAGPDGVAFGPSGELYVADFYNHVIRKIATDGTVSTFAGSGDSTTPGADGAAASAGIVNPGALYVAGSTLYVRDGVGLIRAIDLTTGSVSTFTGSRTHVNGGQADGPPGSAVFDDVSSIGGIAAGVGTGLLVADRLSIRSVDAAGVVTTIATTSTQGLLTDETATGTLANLQFFFGRSDDSDRTSTRIAVDPQGNVIVSDTAERMVRRIDANHNVSLVAGLYSARDSNSPAAPINGIGSAGAFQANGGALAVASTGVIYTSAQYGLERIGTDRSAQLVVGDVNTFGCTDGPVGTGLIKRIQGIVALPSGDVLVSDSDCHAVRRVTANGTISLFAGSGINGRVDGPAGVAQFDGNHDLAAAPDGTFWLTDSAGLHRLAADGTSSTPAGAAGFTTKSIAVDQTTGIVYGSSGGGLVSYNPTTGTVTTLVPAAPANSFAPVIYGSTAPNLGDSQLLGALTVLGPKQILMRTDDTLTLVTLP